MRNILIVFWLALQLLVVTLKLIDKGIVKDWNWLQVVAFTIGPVILYFTLDFAFFKIKQRVLNKFRENLKVGDRCLCLDPIMKRWQEIKIESLEDLEDVKYERIRGSRLLDFSMTDRTVRITDLYPNKTLI